MKSLNALLPQPPSSKLHYQSTASCQWASILPGLTQLWVHLGGLRMHLGLMGWICNSVSLYLALGLKPLAGHIWAKGLEPN